MWAEAGSSMRQLVCFYNSAFYKRIQQTSMFLSISLHNSPGTVQFVVVWAV